MTVFFKLDFSKSQLLVKLYFCFRGTIQESLYTERERRGTKKCIHNVPPQFSLTVQPFDKVALAFM
jgi:hypothetical protein